MGETFPAAVGQTNMHLVGFCPFNALWESYFLFSQPPPNPPFMQLTLQYSWCGDKEMGLFGSILQSQVTIAYFKTTVVPFIFSAVFTNCFTFISPNFLIFQINTKISTYLIGLFYILSEIRQSIQNSTWCIECVPKMKTISWWFLLLIVNVFIIIITFQYSAK